MRSLGVGAGLVCFGVGLALVCGEVAARVFLPPQPRVEVAGVAAVQAAAGPVRQAEQERGIDTVIDWSGHRGVRLRPNTHATIRNHVLSRQDVVLEINSLGLRYPELGPRAAGEFRVLMLGDSITFGDYVPAQETIPGALEALTAGRSRPIRFINAGLPGAGTQDEFYHYLELRNHVQPDLVLVNMYLNDGQSGQHGFYARRVPPPFDRSRLLVWLSRRLTAFNLDVWQQLSVEGQTGVEWREEFRAGRNLRSGDMYHDAEAFDFEVYNAALDFGLAWNQTVWERQTQLVDLFEGEVTGAGSRFAALLLPIHIQVKGTVPDRRPQESFARMCRGLGLTCFDTLPGLQQSWREQQQEMYYDHCHLTAHGNLIAAREILRWLDAEGLIPGAD